MIRCISKQIEAISVDITATIRETMQAIERGGLGIALLHDATTGRFLGLVTDGDIRRALLDQCGLESPIGEVPHPETKTAPVGTPIEELLSLFNKPIRVVPLLDEQQQVVDLAILDQRLRLPVAEPAVGEKELQYVSECVLSGWISSAGKFVTRFERMFAEFCGTEYAVAVSNGTVALHLALTTLGIGPGDEVIVPALTFAATANAVLYAGATPVFADITSDTWTIDPQAISECISPRTKAIIPVHLYGHPADMDPILTLASQHNLFVIEDAAEAHGARYKGRLVGSIGDIGCFSFYGNKIVTTGEGGMLTMNRKEWYEKALLMRDHGMDKNRRYWHEVIGFNYRLTNLQAAIGVAQMEKIDQILRKRSQLAEIYNENLRDISEIVLPPSAPWAHPVCWLYSLLIDDNKTDISRDAFMTELLKAGIDTRPFFYPLTDMPLYRHKGKTPIHYAIANKISYQGFSLPSSVKLTEQDLLRICNQIRNIITEQQ